MKFSKRPKLGRKWVKFPTYIYIYNGVQILWDLSHKQYNRVTTFTLLNFAILVGPDQKKSSASYNDPYTPNNSQSIRIFTLTNWLFRIPYSLIGIFYSEKVSNLYLFVFQSFSFLVFQFV